VTLKYVMHAALRRELERIARVTARPDDDPKHVLRTAAGWAMFKSYLQMHHTVEDDMLWPPMREALADDSDGLALLGAMEAEPSAIDPLLAAIDALLPEQLATCARASSTTGMTRTPSALCNCAVLGPHCGAKRRPSF
jgi:hypothetical protein